MFDDDKYNYILIPHPHFRQHDLIYLVNPIMQVQEVVTNWVGVGTVHVKYIRNTKRTLYCVCTSNIMWHVKCKYRVHVCTCMRAYMYIYESMYRYVHVCTCLYIHVHVCTVCMLINTVQSGYILMIFVINTTYLTLFY